MKTACRRYYRCAFKNLFRIPPGLQLIQAVRAENEIEFIVRIFFFQFRDRLPGIGPSGTYKLDIAYFCPGEVFYGSLRHSPAKLAAADLFPLFEVGHAGRKKPYFIQSEAFPRPLTEEQMAYIRRVTDTAIAHQEEIDAIIEKHAQGWRKDRLARTTLAILRCAICEILYMEDIPNAAAINEAVELCKGYDEPDTVAFVNGVLGGIMRGELGEEAETPAAVQE